MATLAVIPARYASSRFPGKPLALIAGRPMIDWVYHQVQAAGVFDRIIVATDDQRILDAVSAFGGVAQMTDPTHPSGTDRVWEVAQTLPEAQIIVNVQGDEPLINPGDLKDAVEFLKSHNDSVDIITLKAKIEKISEVEDPNVVKVVTTTNGQALYFSRAGIPFVRNPEEAGAALPWFKHIGVYGFRRSALASFVTLPVSPLETLEKLEQLRALEAGMKIFALTVAQAPIGVDTPEDRARVEAILAGTKS